MTGTTTITPSQLAPLALTGAVLAAGGLGVYLFAEQGPNLFVAMIESGMAWCF